MSMWIQKFKAVTEHISRDCKCKFNSTTCNSKQKWNNNICQCECKIVFKCEKDYNCTLLQMYINAD